MENWDKLYDAATPIQGIDPEKGKGNEEYEVFLKKKGLPVKIGSTAKHVALIPRDVKYYPFFQKCPHWWIIPCRLWDGTSIGYVLRGVEEKEYVTVLADNKAQTLFGLEAFGDFEKGTPIVCCEGTKDQITLASVYPYTVALLGGKITNTLFPLIQEMTDTVVLALDPDKKRAVSYQRKKMTEELGMDVRVLTTPQLGDEKLDWGNLHYMIGEGNYLEKCIMGIVGRDIAAVS